MWKRIRRFLLGKRGLEIVEWAIVGGVVVAVGAVVWSSIGDDAERGLESLADAVSVSIPGGGPPGGPP